MPSKDSPQRFAGLCGVLLSFRPPILSAPAFAFHQPGTDQFATQRGSILVVLCEDLVDVFFTIAYSDVKRFHDITQDRIKFLAL
jgi:hypothetical protein